MLNEQQIDLYHRNGFVNGGPVLDDATVDILRAEVLRVIDERERADIPQPVLCRNLNSDESAPIWQIVNIYENYGYDTEIIVASIRNPTHVLDAALMGADIATVPYKVMVQLIKHPLTDIGLEKFLADWKKMG